jgi:ABC-type transport system involved in multi-copper enzyme maturation permease subunit
MFSAYRSEWIKMRRRSILIGGVLMPILTAIFVPLGIRNAVNGGGGRLGPQALTTFVLASDKGLTTLLSRGATLTAVIALAIVASATAVEYSHGTLRNLLVRQPRRLEFLSGKFLALLTFVLLSATIALAVGVVVAMIAAPAQGIHTTAWTTSTGISNLATMYWELVVTVIGYSILGFFSAILFRSAAAAVAVPLVYIVVVENLIGAVWSSAPDWLYGKLLGSVVNGESVIRPDSSTASLSRGLIVGVIYMVGIAIVTAALFRFRDVTS